MITISGLLPPITLKNTFFGFVIGVSSGFAAGTDTWAIEPAQRDFPNPSSRL
jgi:hypothetical protein